MNQSSNETSQNDLKEAIYYLPPNFDLEVLCKSIKQVYPQDGKEIVKEWALKTKNSIPSNFDEIWEDMSLSKYYVQNTEDYLNKKIFKVAQETGWIPKAIRRGKQRKKPPGKRALKAKTQEIELKKEREAKLSSIKQRDVPVKEREYIYRHVTNKFGACYIHPPMKRVDRPTKERDYKARLTKIVDCEVRVVEAIEYVEPSSGREGEKLEVKYLLELDNKIDDRVKAIVGHEELTTKTRFSSFLVSKGFRKFIGKNSEFDDFHEFLINKQDFPTVREANSWGEYAPGVFLFENGIYDTKKKRFIQADDENRIEFRGKYLACAAGREQIMPPKLSLPNDTSVSFLTEKFFLWDQFNGAVNVRVTLGYVVACLFSREIMDHMGSFPLLFKYGERGTGKSSSMDWFMALFGYRQGTRQSVSKQNTMKGMTRLMSLPRSYPFFLDDYRNHETNRQAPDLTTSILNWYHRLGKTMADKSTDNRTKYTPMKASIVMTGNDKPTDPAALSRMIILNYNKFLKKEELNRVCEITDHLDRFSEFIGLVFQNFQKIHGIYFEVLQKNKEFLNDQGFEGRTANNWSVVLAGIWCIPAIIPGLIPWKEDFDPLRSRICEKIRKEAQLQKQHNPLHEFFQVIEHFATQKQDPGSHYNRPQCMLDHRHFKIREFETIRDDSGQQIYQGPILAMHIRGVWNVLEDNKAKITQSTSLAEIEGKLQNSSYFLDKSVQVTLTKSIAEANKTSNRRCYVLNVEELRKKGMLEELIQKACDYEKPDLGHSTI